jgi:hypothetical protein
MYQERVVLISMLRQSEVEIGKIYRSKSENLRFYKIQRYGRPWCMLTSKENAESHMGGNASLLHSKTIFVVRVVYDGDPLAACPTHHGLQKNNGDCRCLFRVFVDDELLTFFGRGWRYMEELK